MYFFIYTDMITKFKIFEDFEDTKDQDWKLSLDISSIWQQYTTGTISLSSFNTKYIEFLNQYKELITEKTSAWDKLQKIITKLDEKKDKINESRNLWDDIYDWGDTNLVEILAIKKDF